MTEVDAGLAHRLHRTLEPYHGVVYFSPEAAAAYAALGVTDAQMGYFGSRAAAMGPVPGEVVAATFFNFAPSEVQRCVPAVWQLAQPGDLLRARLEGIDGTLRRVLGDEVLESAEVAEAAELARVAAEAATSEGRPLYAAHASLEWPEAAHLQLWHALTLLREHRGDGHIAVLVAEGLDGCEALVLHAGTGEVAGSVLQSTRARTDEEWAAAVSRLEARGWTTAHGELTEPGRAARQGIEDRTDELALGPWTALDAAEASRLRDLVRPLSRALVDSGAFGFRPGRPSADGSAPGARS